MRVLMLTGPDNRVFGGHQVQLSKTSAALNGLGLDVNFATQATPATLKGIDVVHAWWPSVDQARKVREADIPLVASTIYIPILSIETAVGASKIGRRLRMSTALARQGFTGRHLKGAERMLEQRTRLRLLFETADLLLPNSPGEAALVQQELGVSTPFEVVPNGFDPSVFNETGAKDWTARRGVVVAARIEPHKGQLLLIRALRKETIPVTIVGARHPDHPSYYEECRRAASRSANINIVDPMPPGGLAEIMRAARVHVLPSRWETTGLVSLEAAGCGCNLVVTDRGHVRDYLGKHAWYCDDLTPRALRTSVLRAHDSGQNRTLIEMVRSRYTWEQAVLATLRGYGRVLHERSRGVR